MIVTTRKSDEMSPYFMLMSDLHIGSAFTSMAKIKEDLETARRYNARILINGDVFDAILPSDRKRFNPNVLSEALRGRADVLNAALDMAVTLLSPYADLIDVIGVGNHDTALEKHHSVDLVLLLVERLNTLVDGADVRYGGYTGYYAVTPPDNIKGARFVFYYHHGSGGDSPITKGIGDFQRKLAWVSDANVIWMGHKHHRYADKMMRQKLCKSGRISHIEVLCVMSGAYSDTYTQQTQADVMQRGRAASYASDWGGAPRMKGGVLVRINGSHDRWTGRLPLNSEAVV